MKKCLLFILLTLPLCFAANSSPIGTQKLFANTVFCKQTRCNQIDKYKYGTNNIHQYEINSVSSRSIAIIIRNKANTFEDIRLPYFYQDWWKEIDDEIESFLIEFSGRNLKFAPTNETPNVKIVNYKSKTVLLKKVVRILDNKGNGEVLTFWSKDIYNLGDITIEIYRGGGRGMVNNQEGAGAGFVMFRVFKSSSEKRLPKVYDQFILEKRQEVYCKRYRC
jgi:hypothetical protein